MTASPASAQRAPVFPVSSRSPDIGSIRTSSFFCVGIYVGTLATAALASSSGLSPLRCGSRGDGLRACRLDRRARLLSCWCTRASTAKQGSLSAVWDSRAGGWSVFGALITFVPVFVRGSSLVAGSRRLSCGITWRSACLPAASGSGSAACSTAVARAGKPKRGWASTCTTRAASRKRRIPVQFMEMAWWLIGLAAFLMLWPHALPPRQLRAGGPGLVRGRALFPGAVCANGRTWSAACASIRWWRRCSALATRAAC